MSVLGGSKLSIWQGVAVLGQKKMRLRGLCFCIVDKFAF